jgi:hypothetical protein
MNYKNNKVLGKHEEYILVQIEETSNLRVWVKVPPCGI